jgi:hypothetical protein
MQSRAGEAGLLFRYFSLDTLAFEHKRNEHSFAAPTFVGREAGQAIAAVDQFLDAQFHAIILSKYRFSVQVIPTGRDLLECPHIVGRSHM